MRVLGTDGRKTWSFGDTGLEIDVRQKQQVKIDTQRRADFAHG